jgi:hypothetical protein
MTDPFESVVGLLQEETEAHRRLLDLARQEQRALVRGDVAALQRLVAAQEEVVGAGAGPGAGPHAAPGARGGPAWAGPWSA